MSGVAVLSAAPGILTLALAVLGFAAAFSVNSPGKRSLGLMLAFAGAAVTLAWIGASGAGLGPQAFAAAGWALAAGLAFLAFGLALAVRLQEAYGVSSLPEIDALDAEADRATHVSEQER